MDQDVNVSVIIPTYNRAHSVARAIESVLMQTYKDYEVIVVDDGSTDKTERILNKYRDKCHIIKQKNQGVSSARNSGIDRARGEWIAFLDSDDEWLPDKLKVQLSEVQREESVIIHVTNGLAVDLKGKDVNYFDKIRINVKQRDSLIKRPFKHFLSSGAKLSASIIKKSAFKKAGYFDPNLTFGEDLDIMLRLSLYGSCINNSRLLARFVQRKENKDLALGRRLESDKVHCLQCLLKALIKWPSDKRLKKAENRAVRNEIASIWLRLAAINKECGNINEAKYNIASAKRSNPSLKCMLKAIFILYR